MRDGVAETPRELTMGATEWLMLLGLSLLWGGSFFFIGVAVQDLPTLTIVLLRVGIASLALWGVVVLTGRRIPREWRIWRPFLGIGLLNNAIPFALIVYGQQTIASGLASILNASTPLFTVLVAGLLLSDERVSLRKLVGVAAGFGGVILMIGPDALTGMTGDVVAQGAVLCGALSYALGGVYGRRFARLNVDPVVVAAGQVTAATLWLLPLTLVVDAPWSLATPSPASVAAVLALALPSTAFAYIVYFRILERAGATNLLLVTFLVPATAILLGAVFLDERLGLVHAAGLLLIGAGLAAIDGRLLKRLRSGRAVA